MKFRETELERKKLCILGLNVAAVTIFVIRRFLLGSFDFR